MNISILSPELHVVYLPYHFLSKLRIIMKNYIFATLSALALVGCASSDVTEQQDAVDMEKVARPDRIIVYDFAATPTDISATAAITGYYDKREIAQTEQEIELGRRLGAQVADKLVIRLRKIGMHTHKYVAGREPDLGDAVIVGQFISIDEGRRGKRVVIGFGSGSGELSVHVEGYLVTQTGHQQLGFRQVETSGGRMPGLSLPLAARSPIGLAANTALTIRGEKGAETLEAAADRAADQVADELTEIFRKRGWM